MLVKRQALALVQEELEQLVPKLGVEMQHIQALSLSINYSNLQLSLAVKVV